MIVDIPVYIAFDQQRGYSPGSSPNAGENVITLRYDIDDDMVPAKVCYHYPPKADAKFWDDNFLFEFMRSDTYRKLKSRAKRSPADYCADEKEGERLQVIADEERAKDG